MKKPSGGLDVGLWVVSGAVAAYLLGAALLFVDAHVLKTRWILDNAPEPVVRAIIFLYTPLGELLDRLLGPAPP